MDQLFLTSPHSITKQASEHTAETYGSDDKDKHRYLLFLDTRR